jgi:hypothetical protein
MADYERLEGKLILLQFSIDAIPDAVNRITIDGCLVPVGTTSNYFIYPHVEYIF